MADTFGKDTLIPVPRLKEQGKVKLLQLVVMEKERGLPLWIKGPYHPTDFQLTDVLQDSFPIDVAKTTSVLVHQYKIGNLFGKLVKTEFIIKELMEELKKRKVDLKHSFIKQHENKVLCLVTGVFHLVQKVSVETNKELDLESKAAVAYNVNELNISKDGSVDLGLHRGFHDPSVDQVSDSVLISLRRQCMEDTFANHSRIHVQMIDEQSKVKLLQLVVMEKTTFATHCIEGPDHPTDFQLTDVLQDSCQIDVAETTMVLLVRDEYEDFFWKLVKTEVKIKELMEELKKRKVDLKHSFIKQVRQDQNKVLCLVTGVFHLAQKVNVETNKELDLASKEAVAYCFNELNISMDGSMDLGLHQGFHDPSVEYDDAYSSSDLHNQVSDNVISSEDCQKMADTFGKNTLIPVLSLDEQGKVNLLQLVIKKKRKFFFWTTYSYRPTDVQLTDVLQDCCPIDVAGTTKRVLLDQYKIGNLFGKLVKTEVKIIKLMEELKKRKVDLKHSFFKQVREDENTVLCLVTGVVHVAKERMCGNLVSEAAISEKVNVETNKELDLASKAAVAYNVNELNISKDGSMDLWLHRGFHDHSVEYDDAYSSSDLHNQVSGSVMFSAACQQLVNSLGKGTLIPVQSLDEQSKVKLYQLVVMEKKRNFFFFTKCSYHPTEFKLKDILQDQPDISVKETDNDLFVNYSSEIMFPRTEKVDVTDFDPDTSDTWAIQAKFGKVVKTEVDKSMLRETLMMRKVDLKHPFIKQVRQDENKVLCVVTEVVHLAKERHTDKYENLNPNAEASAKILLTLSNTEVNVENNKVLGLASNTAIAYNVNELKINLKDGSMEMIFI